MFSLLTFLGSKTEEEMDEELRLAAEEKLRKQKKEEEQRKQEEEKRQEKIKQQRQNQPSNQAQGEASTTQQQSSTQLQSNAASQSEDAENTNSTSWESSRMWLQRVLSLVAVVLSASLKLYSRPSLARQKRRRVEGVQDAQVYQGIAISAKHILSVRISVLKFNKCLGNLIKGWLTWCMEKETKKNYFTSWITFMIISNGLTKYVLHLLEA
jgi:flagellar biosynthesis GTPase FlhF